jgi:hypothetical protein
MNIGLRPGDNFKSLNNAFLIALSTNRKSSNAIRMHAFPLSNKSKIIHAASTSTAGPNPSKTIRINTSIRPTNTVRIILSLQAMHMKLYRLSTTNAANARRTAAKVEPYVTKIIAPRRAARQILHPFMQADNRCIIVSKCSVYPLCFSIYGRE